MRMSVCYTTQHSTMHAHRTQAVCISFHHGPHQNCFPTSPFYTSAHTTPIVCVEDTNLYCSCLVPRHTLFPDTPPAASVWRHSLVLTEYNQQVTGTRKTKRRRQWQQYGNDPPCLIKQRVKKAYEGSGEMLLLRTLLTSVRDGPLQAPAAFISGKYLPAPTK